MNEGILKNSIKEQLPYDKSGFQCIVCGACKKCPQKLSIINDLRDAEECFAKIMN